MRDHAPILVYQFSQPTTTRAEITISMRVGTLRSTWNDKEEYVTIVSSVHTVTRKTSNWGVFTSTLTDRSRRLIVHRSGQAHENSCKNSNRVNINRWYGICTVQQAPQNCIAKKVTP